MHITTRTILISGFLAPVLIPAAGAQTVPPSPTLQFSVTEGSITTLARTITLIQTGTDTSGFPIYNLNTNGAAYKSLAGLGFRGADGELLTGNGWVFGSVGSDRLAFSYTEANTDPYISYAISISDSGAPSNFSFSFSTPIFLPYPNFTLTRANVGVSLTDDSGDGAFATNFLQDSYLNGSLDMNVDIGLTTLSAPNGSTVVQAFNTGFVAGPVHTGAPVFTTLGITTSFSLSGGEDNIAITGRAEIVPDMTQNVPEPGSVALVLTGLGSLALRRRRGA